MSSDTMGGPTRSDYSDQSWDASRKPTTQWGMLLNTINRMKTFNVLLFYFIFVSGSDFTGDDDQYDAEREDSDEESANKPNKNTRPK